MPVETGIESATTTAAVDAGGPDTTDVTIVAPDGSSPLVDVESVEVDTAALPPGFTPAGSAVDVTAVPGAIVTDLVFSVSGEQPPDAMVPVLLHLTDAGVWEPDLATFAAGTYTATVSGFSIRIPGWIDPISWIDSGFDWVTGRTDPPDNCHPSDDGDGDGEPYGWVATQQDGPANGAFHACVRLNPSADGTERVEVIIKSNRTLAQWIVIPEHPYDYLWIEGAPYWDAIETLITEAGQAFGPRRILLPPGRSMTLGYTRPQAPGPTLMFSSYQTNMTQATSLLHKYAGEAGPLAATLSMTWCVLKENERTGDDTRIVDMPTSTIAGCIVDFFKLVGGAAGQTASSVLEEQYRASVAQGRFQLSQGAGDGIERLVSTADDAIPKVQVLRNLGKILQAVTAAQLAGDFVTMSTDALLAFTPGLNTYTVSIVGTPTPEPTPAEPAQFDDLDRSTTYAFAAFESATSTATVREWVYTGETEADWIVGPETTLRIDPGFVYLRQDATESDTNTAEEFATWVQNNSQTDFPQVFWIAQRPDGTLYAAQVEWDVTGSGECAEIDLAPLNDNCYGGPAESSPAPSDCVTAAEVFAIMEAAGDPLTTIEQIWCADGFAEVAASSGPDGYSVALSSAGGQWTLLGASVNGEAICRLLQDTAPNWGC